MAVEPPRPAPRRWYFPSLAHLLWEHSSSGQVKPGGHRGPGPWWTWPCTPLLPGPGSCFF